MEYNELNKHRVITQGLFREALGMRACRLCSEVNAENIQTLADNFKFILRVSTEGLPYLVVMTGDTERHVYYNDILVWSEAGWELIPTDVFKAQFVFKDTLDFPFKVGERVLADIDSSTYHTWLIEDIIIDRLGTIIYKVSSPYTDSVWVNGDRLGAAHSIYGSLDGITWHHALLIFRSDVGVDTYEICGKVIEEQFIIRPRFSTGHPILDSRYPACKEEVIHEIELEDDKLYYITNLSSIPEAAARPSDNSIMGEVCYLRQHINTIHSLESKGKLAIVSLLQKNGDRRTLRALSSTPIKQLAQDALVLVRRK